MDTVYIETRTRPSGGSPGGCSSEARDFQIVEDVNLAMDVLGGDIKRTRPWRAQAGSFATAVGRK